MSNFASTVSTILAPLLHHGKSLLDKLPPCRWFFGFGLINASFIIAGIGIGHPLLYCYTCRHRAGKFRDDYWYAVMWISTAIWFCLSALLLAGILKKWEIAYGAWIYFTFVFSTIMSLLWLAKMYLYFFCNPRRPQPPMFLFLLFTILFYLMTFYFIFVLNTRRMEAFPEKERKSMEVRKLRDEPVTNIPDMF